MGKALLIAGLVIAGIGLLMMLGIRFGQLPGDITWRRGNTTFYFPLVTSILLSLILTVLFALLKR